MTPTEQTEMETSTTTPTNSTSNATGNTTDPNPAPAYADQSRSRLMTLPKEIRNYIYMFVFCDNIDYVREPVRYDRECKPVMADAPTRIHLVQPSPPSKETISACRELYSETKEMYAAAYRAYWSDNRFMYKAGQHWPKADSPTNRDVQHIRHFCVLTRFTPEYYLHIVFQEGKWGCWLLPVDGRILAFYDRRCWAERQRSLEIPMDRAARYIPPSVLDWSSLDPSKGCGLTSEKLLYLANDKVLNIFADRLSDEFV